MACGNSFTALTVVFFFFFFFQNKLVPLSLSLKVNAFTTWLAFFVTALNSHHQQRVEAQKDEELNSLNLFLQKKSLIDDLTLLPNMNYFYKTVGEFIVDEKKSIGCLRLQEYLFGKPMPKEEFTSKVNSGFYQV